MATSARKLVTMQITVSAPAGTAAAKVRREVKTRINDLTGHFFHFDLRLPDSACGNDGNLKIRVANIGPAS